MLMAACSLGAASSDRWQLSQSPAKLDVTKTAGGANVSTFELTEEQVSQIEERLLETGESVDKEATAAEQGILGLNGSGWSGSAAVAAVNQQTGPFAEAKRTLHSAINEISEALGMGRVLTVTEDMNNEEALLAINPDIANRFTARV